MTVKTKYVDVVFGAKETKYVIEDNPDDIAWNQPGTVAAKDIGIDSQTGWLLVYMHDGDTQAFNTICPWKICTHDDGIVVPEIITDVTQ